MTRQILTGAAIFDGTRLHHGPALVIEDGHVAALTDTPPSPGEGVALQGGVLAPGMIDLQVNGGGGVMVDGAATPGSLAALCAIHARLGATGIMPTLITDTPEATAAVIAAGIAAARARVPGFLGLHLEGPHLDLTRAGAHDPALIRPMGDDDLARLCAAAGALPALMVTLAPGAATPEQITALCAAGAVVSLGHSGCTYDQARAARNAGASAVTHLFNAMSGLGHREPGLAGAALALGFDAGLIADGHHVHPALMRLALDAKRTGRIFLVSDAMAVAGTDETRFTLGGREILRQSGPGASSGASPGASLQAGPGAGLVGRRLTLADGTLAGADLTLPAAVAMMVRDVGLPLERALAMATAIPAAVIGQDSAYGHLLPGRRADIVHLGPDSTLRRVWWGGACPGTSAT